MANLASTLEDWCGAISSFEMAIRTWMGHWFSVLR